jgi:hypothetical protein
MEHKLLMCDKEKVYMCGEGGAFGYEIEPGMRLK